MIFKELSSHKFLSFLILFLIYFFNVLSRIIFSPLMPLISQDMNLAADVVGNMFLILSIGFGFSLFFSQYISKRTSHKRTILYSVFFSSFALLILSMGNDLLSFRLGLFFLGISSGLFLPSSIALISQIFPTRYWGRIFGVFSAAQSMAFLSAPFLVEFFLPLSHWKTIILIIGMLSLLLTFLMLFFPSKEDSKGEAINLQILQQLIKWPSFWIVLFLLALINGFNIGVFNMVPHYFSSLSFEVFAVKTNYVLILTRAFGIFAALIGGWIMDLFGIRKSLSHGLIICSIATFLMGIAPAVSKIAFSFQAVLAICLTPIIHISVASLAPPGKNSMFVSIFSSFGFFLGAGVMPQILGYMAKYGRYPLGFILLGTIGIFSGIFLFWKKSAYFLSAKFEFIEYKKVEE